jgi:hypothetical protein
MALYLLRRNVEGREANGMTLKLREQELKGTERHDALEVARRWQTQFRTDVFFLASGIVIGVAGKYLVEIIVEGLMQ